MSGQRRPWRHRVWFWAPQWHWFGWRTLVPVYRGGDEFDWHTLMFGWTVTGRVIVATRPCPRTGRCDEPEMDWPMPQWPVDHYGCNHLIDGWRDDEGWSFERDARRT